MTIPVEYRWVNPNGVVTSRTIQQITVPRIGELVTFAARGRKFDGRVQDVAWKVTEKTSEAFVILIQEK